jgi:hypothetical protein
MKHIYNIFGSASSQDLDVMVFIDRSELSETIKERAELCEQFNQELSKVYDKKVNANIAVMDSGIVDFVHKGTSDEVNNSIFDTYDLHEQVHPLVITRKVRRDIDLKLMRAARIILSFLSRTEHRSCIKQALKTDFVQKIITLQQIDYTKLLDFGSKNTAMEDAYKVIAFQYGQVLGLMKGHEHYTKESISGAFPDLKPFLMRSKELNLTTLNSFNKRFLDFAESRVVLMKTLHEYEL